MQVTVRNFIPAVASMTNRPGYEAGPTGDGRWLLKLVACSAAAGEIHVINTQLGTPIPFEWIDSETISVDEGFARVAGIQMRPRQRAR